LSDGKGYGSGGELQVLWLKTKDQGAEGIRETDGREGKSNQRGYRNRFQRTIGHLAPKVFMKVDCTVHYSSFCLYFFFHAELGTFRETAVLRVFVTAKKVGRAPALRQRFTIKRMEASATIQGFGLSLLSREVGKSRTQA
jgi:hypothetical protein